MKTANLSKIIYFDKETISNILQQLHKGTKSSQEGKTNSINVEDELNVSGKFDLSLPLWKRIRFLFTGKIDVSHLWKRDTTTTVTSTEISQFENLKKFLVEFKSIEVNDIKNSSTFIRVAGGYLKIIKDGIEDVDEREFKDVMDSYEGYDTYKISDDEYVRFNNTAFVSNYKRNDLLTTNMNLYCVYIGEVDKDKFNFLKQFEKMETLITTTNNEPKTLADLEIKPNLSDEIDEKEVLSNKSNKVKLYDVVYADIQIGGTNE